MKGEGLLERFNKEVLLSGTKGTLPKNLSDEWLEVLLNQSSSIKESDEDARVTELVAAVLHIHCVKNALKSVSISESELIASIEKYSVELAIEELRRKTNLKGIPATISTIFTDRIVNFTIEK